jgi:hypothetical protein
LGRCDGAAICCGRENLHGDGLGGGHRHGRHGCLCVCRVSLVELEVLSRMQDANADVMGNEMIDHFDGVAVVYESLLTASNNAKVVR